MKAFTLIELLLVLVLLTAMTALALPNLGRTFNYIQLQNTVNRLSYTMRYAQSKAITQNKKIKLEFENSFKKYRLLDSGLESDQFQPLQGRWGQATRIPEDMTVASTTASVLFLPNGNIEKTNIRLCDKKDCIMISTQEQRGQIETFDTDASSNTSL